MAHNLCLASFKNFVCQTVSSISAPYPQSNGQAERFVDTLKRALKKSVDGAKMEDTLQQFLQSYRATPNRNAPEGVSSWSHAWERDEDSFSYNKTTTSHIITTAKYGVVQRENQSEQFDKKHSARSRSFDVNDWVYAKVHRRNHYYWCPGEVIERMGKVLYKVLLNVNRVHINQLRPRSSEQEKPSQNVIVDAFSFVPVSSQDGLGSLTPTTADDTICEPIALPDEPPTTTTVPALFTSNYNTMKSVRFSQLVEPPHQGSE